MLTVSLRTIARSADSAFPPDSPCRDHSWAADEAADEAAAVEDAMIYLQALANNVYAFDAFDAWESAVETSAVAGVVAVAAQTMLEGQGASVSTVRRSTVSG